MPAKKNKQTKAAIGIQRAKEEWQKHSVNTPDGFGLLRRDRFVTSSGLEIPHCSFPTSEVWDESNYLRKLSFPGEFPFTRGIHPTMYRSRMWTMRQYAGFGTAREANQRYRYLLSQGTTGLSVAFDLPTQMGRDPDHELARGEVGRVGVSISHVRDMEDLLSEIPLDQVSTSMTINATAHILLALYLAIANRRGIAWAKLRGTVQNDILKEYIARGTYIYPPKPALKIATDIMEFCRDAVPQWNTMSISGYHIREAGSTAAQEVAFTLSDAITYVEAALKRGMNVDSFAPRIAFFFNCHNNFFEEIAKFRAARRIWARIMKERFGAQDKRSCMLRFHTQTAGSSLTAQQPEVNIVRTTLQALAAVLGGTQSLHTNAYDEALGLPTEESARLALRTQQVIAHESGVTDFVDALGGSYSIEELTDGLESAALKYIEEIDSRGGMLRAIDSGYPQAEIEEAAFCYQQGIETGENSVVGVNAFSDSLGEKEKGRGLKVDPDLELNQREKVQALRESRDSRLTHSAIDDLRTAVQNDRNIMPAIVVAVEQNATVGEISDVLRECFGQYE